MKRFINILIIAFLLTTGASASAQFGLPNLEMKPSLTLSADPITPVPNSAITVTANLAGITDVSNSNYTWFLNGARQSAASGINKNQLTFAVGGLGAAYRISVTVITPTGDNLSDSITVTASDFDLTWSANSYVPAGYRGKILPAQNSSVSVSALPFIYQPGTRGLIGATGLIYNWYEDGKLQQTKSGLNRPDYVFKNAAFPGSDKQIRLEVRTGDKSVSLIKEISIPAATPKTYIYLSDSKTGKPFGVALGNLTLSRVNSLNFFAQNYFFGDTPARLKWLWLVDGAEVPGATESPWLSSFNIPAGISLPFSTQIKVLIQNPANNLERSESSINLNIK